MKKVFLLTALVAFSILKCAWGDSFGSGLNSFDIEFVAIGNRINPADATGDPSPAGSVPYPYRMGKHEISAQMISKANVLGGIGIVQDNRAANQPATSVNWNEAARFVNWLNTSTGSWPAYKFALQPGDRGYSAVQDILLWSPGDPGYDPNNLYRNSKARYFLPSVDEWYKAAYYDPASGVYYNYPTGSNSEPTSVTSGTTTGTAVYANFSNTGPADITLAGGLSRYGSMGQGGNVYEWQESSSSLLNESASSDRVLRGGNWDAPPIGLDASFRINFQPAAQSSSIGFRVASIPEPTTISLGAFATLGLRIRRRR
jgi:formylglycine-generating enzyme